MPYTVEIHLKTKERRIIEPYTPHPDDKDITVLAPLFLPDVIKKMIEYNLLNPALLKE